MKENYVKSQVDHGNKCNTTNAAIKSLKQKQKNGIIVYETDKTSKFVVDTLENFEHKMQPHIQKDPIVEPKIAKKVENNLNSHTTRLINIFNMGEASKQKKRTKMNLVTKENPIPVIFGSLKDHKECKDPLIGPELRPIMAASIGPNTGLSQIGCHFLQSILDDVNNEGEIKCTEELLSEFTKYNHEREIKVKEATEKGKNVKEKVIGSMDIKSFYPSINPKKVALVARIMWNKSNIRVKNVDVKKLSMYVGEEIDKEKVERLNLEEVVYTKKLRKSVTKKRKKNVKENDWIIPKRNPNEQEVKTMVGLIIENVILLCMENHLYQFNGDIRIQSGTGATGLDLTGLVADVYMLWWDGRFRDKLKDLSFPLDLYKRFKDDINTISDPLPLGTRYCPKNNELQYETLLYRKIYQNQEEREIYETKNIEKSTMFVLHQIANSVDSMIKFSFDHPSNHKEGKMPVLDLKVHMDNEGYVIHEYYEKPTKNPNVILPSSALSWKVKRTVFTQEALRRIRNTSQRLGPHAADEVLSNFMLKLKMAGYNHQFRAEIIKSAKHAFNLQLKSAADGEKPLYRDKNRILEDKKTRGRQLYNWWNRKGSSTQKYDTVVFVPPTPGSKLAKLMQRKEAAINSNGDTRIKIIERGGIKLKHIITSRNPFPPAPCFRQTCPVCKETTFTDPVDLKSANIPCTKMGVTYQYTCLACQAKGVLARYEGETGRPFINRATEHIRGLRKDNKSNPMVKHLKQDHKSTSKSVKFKIDVNQAFKDPLSRQAREGVRISNPADSAKIFNSKSEFNHPRLARIKIVT